MAPHTSASKPTASELNDKEMKEVPVVKASIVRDRGDLQETLIDMRQASGVDTVSWRMLFNCLHKLRVLFHQSKAEYKRLPKKDKAGRMKKPRLVCLFISVLAKPNRFLQRAAALRICCQCACPVRYTSSGWQHFVVHMARGNTLRVNADRHLLERGSGADLWLNARGSSTTCASCSSPAPLLTSAHV